MTPSEKLAELGLTLPPPANPVGAYVPAVRTGDLIFTAGQIPVQAGQLLFTGTVPTDVSVDEARTAARQAVLNALSAVVALTGTLDAVTRIVRVNVFVASANGFTDQAQVANGASELLVDIFGDVGVHTRCAIGAAELPLAAPVELDMIVEVN